MSGFVLAKLGAQIVAGLGVSKIVGDIVRNNVAVITTAERVMVGTGSFVLGSMLIEQSTNHIEKMANELKNSVKVKIEKNKTEIEAE